MATKLYVGNLSYNTTNDSLRDAFAQAGAVVSATVLTDRMSGRSRGFGFVEMEDASRCGTAKTLTDGNSASTKPARWRSGRRDGLTAETARIDAAFRETRETHRIQNMKQDGTAPIHQTVNRGFPIPDRCCVGSIYRAASSLTTPMRPRRIGHTTDTTASDSKFIDRRRKSRASRMMRMGTRWPNPEKEPFRIKYDVGDVRERNSTFHYILSHTPRE